MLKEFAKYILENRFQQAEGKTLLAVSGGVDSVVLARLFYHSGFDFAIAHCNFQLRGNESDGDEEFVKKLASDLSVPFYSVQFDTSKIAEEQKKGIQETARDLRYEWLNQIAKKHGCDKIATAHHLDDNIETVLFNFANGTGIRGMSGIRPIRGNIIRPLLFATKDQIVAFAAKEGIRYREDASNSSDIYARNYIRHHIIPAFEQVAPNFRKTAKRTIENFTDSFELLRFIVEKARKETVMHKDELTSIDLKRLLSYPAHQTLLFELLRPFGFNRTQVKNILEPTDYQSGRNFSSSAYKAVLSNFVLIIKRKDNSIGVNLIIDKFEKSIKLPSGRLQLSTLDGPPSVFIRNTNIVMLDKEKLDWPLTVRRWQAGDSFQPLGMHGHRKKVQDLFTDLKLSKFEKEAAWILESGGNIAWVVGMRMDDRFKVTDSTKSCLRIEYEPLAE